MEYGYPGPIEASHDTANILVEPFRPDYARQPITEGFDWRTILQTIATEHGTTTDDPLYLVVFRSQRAPNADAKVLMEYDQRAHEAAKRSPALLYYFGGDADPEGYCLSFCLWTDRKSAHAATREPSHQAAVGIADTMYTSFMLERYDVYQFVQDEEREVVFVPYKTSA